MPRYYPFIALWGARYREWTCRYAIPSLLAPGNLPALKDLPESRFLFATPEEDWLKLQDDPAFQRLAAVIEPVWIRIEDEEGGRHKYSRMGRSHAALMERCFQDQAVSIFINTDSVYPSGTIAEGRRLIESGKTVLLHAAIRFDLEGCDRAFREGGHFKPDGTLSLTNREAVGIGLKNLHRESLASDWASPNFGSLHPAHDRAEPFLTCCYWAVPKEEGVILVTHNWGPIFLNHAALHGHDTDTLTTGGEGLDGSYLYNNFKDSGSWDRLHIVEDSDSLFPLGMTPSGEMAPPEGPAYEKAYGHTPGESDRKWILNQTVFDPLIDPMRRLAYRKKIRWHTRDIITPAWQETEKLSQDIIDTCAAFDFRQILPRALPARLLPPLSLYLRTRLKPIFRTCVRESRFLARRIYHKIKPF